MVAVGSNQPKKSGPELTLSSGCTCPDTSTLPLPSAITRWSFHMPTSPALSCVGGTGSVTGVPAGGNVTPAACCHASATGVPSSADLTAGTATLKVTSSDTEISNGPEPVLSDTVQRASAVARVGASPRPVSLVLTISSSRSAAG